jgi:DNA polymerase III subunit epsilon
MTRSEAHPAFREAIGEGRKGKGEFKRPFSTWKSVLSYRTNYRWTAEEEQMYLFFDTETAGIPKNRKAPASDSPNWPRLVQLAWLSTDANGAEQKSAEYIIKPRGFSIPQAATRIHGITNEFASQRGVDLGLVLEEIVADLTKAMVLIAHNLEFDEKIVGAEFFRLGHRNHFDQKKKRCTMKSATNFCQLPGRYGYKWPSLDELHTALFREDFDNRHSALADVRACARCYFELRRLGVMD